MDGGFSGMETIRQKRDGTLLDVSISAASIQDADGHVIHIMVTYEDITERKQAEAALRKIEARQAKMVANIGDVIVIIDQEGINRYKSPSIEKWFGWKPEEVLGVSTWENVHPEDRVLAQQFIGSLLKKANATGTAQCRYQCKDGSYKWIEFTGVNLLHDPDIKGILGNYQDVTERKRAEVALRESETRYRELVESTASISWEYDIVKDRWAYVAPQVKTLLGWMPEDWTNLAFWVDNLHPDDRGTAVDHCMLWTGRGQDHMLEYRFRSKEGHYVWLRDVAVVEMESGKPVKLRGIMIDITNRKQAELALRESEQRLQAIFQSNANPMVVYDAKGHPQYLNPAFTELFGWTLEQLKGRRIPFVPDDQIALTTAKIAEVYSGTAVKFSSKRLTRTGRTIDVIVSAGMIRGAHGKGTGMVVNLTDISEQRRLEHQLGQAQKMESVGRLAGGVAHDFNNMLSVIIGNTELAVDNLAPDDPLHDTLQEIFDAATRSADITRQLLAFARKQTIAPKVLDLNTTVEGMLKMLRPLIGEDIDLAWMPATGLWPVKMDPSQIDQILVNLCVNARDAIAGVGKITIETNAQRFDETQFAAHAGLVPGEYVLLAVSDDGCGMDRQTLGHLFEPFFTTKAIDKGTGLGLAMIYGIVKQNNGFINVYSEPGQGTTFKIYLPRHQTVPQQVRGRAPTAADARGNETILLVEDEKAILRMTTMMLQRLGYTVLEANTPGKAIALAREHAGEIHLLMTDVVMPEMNGRDLSRSLLSLYPNLKRLFMSGYTANVIAHHGVLDEGVQFISKPFTKLDLSIKVREVLDEPGSTVHG
jgi:two-component system, cell cycle sensor histidine kinase and response regulator CckA